MVTMNWTMDGQGRLTPVWQVAGETKMADEKPIRAYHKAVHPAFKTRRPARRRLLRTLALTGLVG